MSDEANLIEVLERPELPENRLEAITLVDEITDRINDANRIQKATGVEWAYLLQGKTITSDNINELMNAVDVAEKEMGKVSERLKSINADTHSMKIEEAREIFSKIRTLSNDHINSYVAGQIAGVETEDLQSIINECEHLVRTENQIKDKISSNCAIFDIENDAIEADAAASAIIENYSVNSIEEANVELARLRKMTAVIEKAVRQFSIISARLDETEITIKDLAEISAACEEAKNSNADILKIIPDVSDKHEEAISAAKKRFEKIKNAVSILDEQFGSKWKLESSGDLERTLSACAKGHPSRQAAIDHARSLGFTSTSHIEAAFKTKKAIAEFNKDEQLKHFLPRLFNGMDTNFNIIEEAIAVREKIEAIVSNKNILGKLIAGFSSKNEATREEFIGYKKISTEIDAIKFEIDTPVRLIRGIHADKVTKLASLIVSITTLPLAVGEADIRDAMRLGYLVKEMRATRNRIEENSVFNLSGAENHYAFLEATAWRDSFLALLGENKRPKSADEFASLAITARDGEEASNNVVQAISKIKKFIPEQANPDQEEKLTSLSITIEQVRQAEPAFHSQVLICETMQKMIHNGLFPFIARMTEKNINNSEWHKEIRNSYETLDEVIREEERNAEILAAAEEAQRIEALTMSIPENFPEPKEKIELEIDLGWITQEVGEVLNKNISINRKTAVN